MVAWAMVWAFSKPRARNWLIRFAVGFGVAVMVLMMLLSRLQGLQTENVAVQSAMEHQINGLTHPMDEKHSSVGLHWKFMSDGFLFGFRHPLGYGLGATTLGVSKFGDAANYEGGGTEVDISDMFKSLGFVGGFIYLYIVFLSMRSSINYAQNTRSPEALAILAMLVVNGGNWLQNGQYVMNAIVWFLIGALARIEDQKSQSIHLRIIDDRRWANPAL
jgi:hypothetical protein